MSSYAELHGWKIGGPVTKFWRGKYITLHRLSKPCSQCGTELTLDVSKAALDGTAKNSGIGLARCLGCRAAARLQGATSRPTALKSNSVVPAPALQQAALDIQPANSVPENFPGENTMFEEMWNEEKTRNKALQTEVEWFRKENTRLRSQLPETPITRIKGPWNP
jgi:hypothetical protein